MKKCWDCGCAIEAKRLTAVPTTNFCIACVDYHVNKTTGYQVISGKCESTIQLSTEVGEAAINWMRLRSRKGVHASLPFSNREHPSTLSSRPVAAGEAEFDSIRTPQESVDPPLTGVTNLIPAACHPNRPAVANRKCVECALEWYRKRLPKEGMRNR